MFCGSTASFKNVDDEESTPLSPKRSMKKASKNPYSTRGLDKYSTVLAELEARRANIIKKAGPQGVSVVKFMYSNSTDWIPVVVRRRDLQKEDKDDDDATLHNVHQHKDNLPPPPAKPNLEGDKEVTEESSERRAMMPELKVKSSFKVWEWRNWRENYYWALVMLLVLLCLVSFGRVFAICCMSVWWYLVPVVHGEGRGERGSSNKIKYYGRRMSDKRISGGNPLVAPSSHVKKAGRVQVVNKKRA